MYLFCKVLNYFTVYIICYLYFDFYLVCNPNKPICLAARIVVEILCVKPLAKHIPVENALMPIFVF